MNETYKCAICGKEYDELSNRILCETSCIKKRDEAEKKRKELELEAKKNERVAEVNKAYDTYVELLKKYVEDYHTYSNVRKDDFFTCADIFKNIIGY